MNKVVDIAARIKLTRCVAAARVAVLDGRLYANGRKVTHTEVTLPPGLYTLAVVENDFGYDNHERPYVEIRKREIMAHVE